MNASRRKVSGGGKESIVSDPYLVAKHVQTLDYVL
jgi:hypothetical protein